MRTSDIKGAGTVRPPSTGLLPPPLIPLSFGTHDCLPLFLPLQDANVFLSLSGTLRSEEAFELDKCLNHTDKFERGSEDIFEFRLPPLGNLLSAKVMHDNSGLTNADVCCPPRVF